MLDEERIKQALATAEAGILAELVEQTKQRVIHAAEYAIQDAVGRVVNRFVADKLTPQLEKALADQEGAILGAAQQAAVAMGEALAVGLVTDARKNLASEWKRRELIKNLLG